MNFNFSILILDFGVERESLIYFCVSDGKEKES
jgi:hypothetical protein